MRTIQILQQLINNISDNPSVLPLIPWNDVKLCLSAELEDHRFLYPDEQFSALLQEIADSYNQILEAANASDVSALVYYLSQIIYTLQFLPETDYISGIYEQGNFDHACLNHYKNNTIVVLGDSHVNFFSGNELLSFLPIGKDINTCTPAGLTDIFTPLHLGPCLAYTCMNKESSFRFHEKVEYLCDNFIKPGATILCALGEIDLRVHVFQQTLRQQKSYQEIVDDILANYFSFLLQLKEKNYNLYVWGPIATQSDDCPVDPNFPRNGSEEERNKATAYFNQQLSSFCSAHNIGFLSVYEQMVSPDHKTRTEYLSADRCHLGQSALSIAKKEWVKINHPNFRSIPL